MTKKKKYTSEFLQSNMIMGTMSNVVDTEAETIDNHVQFSFVSI